LQTSRDPFDDVLDAIYDAATDEAAWPAVLAKVAGLTGALGGVLYGQSIDHRIVQYEYNGRLSEDVSRIYRERHIQNPLSMPMRHRPVGELVMSYELVPLHELRRTAFFDEVMRPQGAASVAMAPLAQQNSFQAALNIVRGERQGPFEPGQHALLQRLLPHLQRALALRFRVSGYQALQRADQAVLDSLSAGVFLLDRAGRVSFANAAAAAFTGDDSPLRLRQGVLEGRLPPHARALSRALAAVAGGEPTTTLTLPRPGSGRRVAVLIHSVRGADLDRFESQALRSTATMLFVSDPAQATELPPRRLAEALGLTPAEARVAACAARVGGVAEIASELGLSTNTVKTHLRRIYGKAGVTRLAELVRLLASLGLTR
jgi:DNA-binding CsgD family transcriptional regulator/PAS domain-containing protein